MKLLLAEDSVTLQRSLSAGLRNSGYVIDQAFDGLQAEHFLQTETYDAIILDIMMPGIDGLELLERLRRRGDDSFVLILSARDSTDDRIRGLDIGADDYLVKPFSFDELLSRLRAMTRRSKQKLQWTKSILTCGDLTVNTADRSVAVNGTSIDLTPNEYSILELLMRRRGQVFSHDQIIDRLYAMEQSVTRNTIEVHISALRRKLRQATDAGDTEQFIRTRRGFGYFIPA